MRGGGSSGDLTPVNRKRVFRGLKEFHKEIQKMSQEEFEECLRKLKQLSGRSSSSCLHDSRNQCDITVPSILNSLNNEKELDEEEKVKSRNRGKSAKSSARGKQQPKQKLNDT